MRRKNQMPTWQQVVYQQSSEVPMQRWGHQLVKVSEDKIILFGGFGGTTSEGKYLDDLWQFNTIHFTWKQLHPSGQIPQKRSNYIIHHNPIDHQLILFGGGSSNKIRYNDICLLDLATLTWSKHIPDPSQQAPWERTYHTGIFLFPFLVIFGGEGGPNMDLDDSWSFNIQTKKWRRLCFQQNEQSPDRRRFHSSVLIGTSMYIISGCKNANYDLYGDIHRVDLQNLLREQSEEKPLVWERVVQNNIDLKRWGQSCNLFDGKIFIFAGRINQNQDTNKILLYNPQDHSIQQVKISDRNLPNPRRRHSSVMIGSSLLIFGGYNGKYYNDFHYLPLKGLKDQNHSIQTKIYQFQQFNNKLSQQQSKLQQDFVLQLHFQGKVMKIQSNQNILNKSEYLKCIYKYSEDKNLIQIYLPIFCSAISFRIIHYFLSAKQAIFSSDFHIQFLIQLLKSAEYFNCQQIYPFIGSQLTKFLTADNSKYLLKECIKFPLNSFINAAIDIIIQKETNYIKNKGQLQEENVETMKNLKIQSEDFLGSNQDCLIYLKIKQARQSSKFEISQQILRNRKASIFRRAANSLKSIFSSKQGQIISRQTVNEGSEDKISHSGCFQRFINFFMKFRLGSERV